MDPIDFSQFKPERSPVSEGEGASSEAPDFSQFVAETPGAAAEAPDFSAFEPDVPETSFGDKVAATYAAGAAGVADAFQRTVQGAAGIAADVMTEYPVAKFSPLGGLAYLADKADSALLGRTGQDTGARVLREFEREAGRARQPVREVRAAAEEQGGTSAHIAGMGGDIAGTVSQAVLSAPISVPLLVSNAGQGTADMLPPDATPEQIQAARSAGGITGVADRLIPGSLEATGVKQVLKEAVKQGTINVLQGTAQRGIAKAAGAEGVDVFDPKAMALEFGLGSGIPLAGAAGRKGLEAVDTMRAKREAAGARAPSPAAAPEVRPVEAPANAPEFDVDSFIAEPAPVEAAPVHEAGEPPALPVEAAAMPEAGEAARAPGEASPPETFTIDDYYGVPAEAVRAPDEAVVPEPDTSVPFEAAEPTPMAELPESVGPALRRRFAVSEEVRNARIARAQEAKAAEWAAQLKPGVDADLDTGAPVWSALPEERVNAALDLPQFRTQAEAELSRRFNAEVENDARAASGDSLDQVMGKTVFLPKGADKARVARAERSDRFSGELSGLKGNVANQGKWMNWVKGGRASSLEHTLEQAHEAGFRQFTDINDLLDGLERTARGEKIYPLESPVLADKAPGARGNIEESLRAKYGDRLGKLAVSEGKDKIKLGLVVVNPDARGKGVGGEFMRDLIAHADAVGKPIALTPSADFGGNVGRLKEWYKSLGFVENKGRNRDFSISESMYRNPGVLEDRAPVAPTPAQEKAQRAAMRPDREALPADTAGRVSIDPTGGERYVFPAETPGWDMPAFVKLGHELGATLKVRDLGEGKGGDFSPGRNRLRLNKELFKNPQEALRVMAHEIGHLVDTKNTGLKGPVWERLAGAKGAAQEAFALEGTLGAEGRIPDANDRKGAWLAAKGITEGALGPRDQYVAEASAFGKGAALKAGADWDAAQAQAFRDHWGKLLKTEGWGTGAMIRDELKRWSETIRPYDKATADPKFTEYRNSPDEITADALSGILAYPKTFAQVAPTAWRAFWGHLESRPVTAGKILEGIELLNGSPAKRAKQVSLDFQKGGYEAGEKYLARMEEEKAARERIDANRLRQIAMGARRTLLDKFAPARNARNTFALDDAAHADGRIWEWTGRLQHELYEPLKQAGVDTRDFGELLMLRRILGGDRSEFANPGGVDKSYATKQAAEVLNRYTPAQRAMISQGFAKVSALWREAMNTAVESGLISPEMLAELRAQAGETYVPFAAAEHFTGNVGAGIKAMQGNLGGIVDPILALGLKAGSIFRAAALNKGRLAALDGLSENIPDLDISLAKSDPRTGRAVENPKPGMVHVEVARGGERQTWNVPAEYKTIFEAMTPANAAPMGAALRWMFANGWRQMMIGKNIAFQAWSGPIKDARRSFINMPGIDSASLRPSVELAYNILLNAVETTGVKVPKALQSKYRQAAVDFVEGRPNKLTDALVREGGMPPPHELFAVQKAASPAHMQDAAILEMFRQRKLLPEEVAERSGLTKIMGVKQAADFVRYMGKRVERLGQTNEALVKTAAFGELLKRGANEADAGRFVRTQIGIPDTRQGGDFSRIVNTIAPFYNVATTGARADLNQMVRGLPEFSGSSIKGLNTPGQVRRAAITKLMVGTGVPVIAAVLARQGLFGDKAKEVMGRVSDHDERTGIMIPVGEVRGRDGMMKTVAIKVPYDASEIWFANAIKNSLEAALGQTGVTDAAGEQLKATTDMVPGLDPTVNLLRAWTSYAKGDNPTDNWRQSPIIRQAAQGARATGELGDKLPALWDMSAWTLAQTGWWSHKPDDGGPGAEGVEGAAAWPFLSRALRVTNAGEIESMRKADAVFDGQADALRATLPEPVQRLGRELSGVRDLYPTLVDKMQRGQELTPAEQSRLERYRVLNAWGSHYNELVRAAVLAKRQGDKATEADVKRTLEEVSKPYYPGAQ